MNIEIQPELENAIKQEINSYYKVINVSQQGSLPSFNSSKNQILIEIPSDIVFNPSLLSLSFTRGATLVSTGGLYHAIPTNYIPYFSRCELYSSSNNIRLIDCQSLDVYNKGTSQLFQSFLKNQDNYNYSSTRSILTTAVTTTTDYFYDSAVASDRFLTYSNYEYGALDGVLASRTINIKLCDLIPMSFFSINKNIYSSSILYLRLETNILSNILFNLGANANNSYSFSGLTTSIPITNLSLNIFCEANPDLINIARQQQNSKEGLSLVLPEINNSQYSISNSAGTRGSIVKVVNNSSPDARLYMILSFLTNTGNATTTYTINNMSNIGNAKYNQVQLYINSNQILNLDTILNQDMSLVDNMFENHSFNSTIAYKNISPFVYSFSTKKIKNNILDGNLLDGATFPSGGEITLNILYNCVAPVAGGAASTIVNSVNQTAYNHNIFTVTKRKIYMKDGRFSYVPFG